MSKNLNISLRVTEEGRMFVEKMGEMDERSVSSIMNKMIEHFMQEGTPTKALKKLYKR